MKPSRSEVGGIKRDQLQRNDRFVVCSGELSESTALHSSCRRSLTAKQHVYLRARTVRTRQGGTTSRASKLTPLCRTDTGTAHGERSGWMSDPERFSKVVADHYVRTEYPSLSGRAEKIWCREDKKICQVDYSTGIQVGVSFVRLPDYVIARRWAHPTGPPVRIRFRLSAFGRTGSKETTLWSELGATRTVDICEISLSTWINSLHFNKHPHSLSDSIYSWR
jgi:hypothetical protein